MDIVIFALTSGASALVTGFTIAGIRFVAADERRSRRNFLARLMMSIIAWREVQARRVVARYHLVDWNPPETRPYLPGQVGFSCAAQATADALCAAASLRPAALPNSEQWPDGGRAHVAAGATGKSADSCRLPADPALCKTAKSDEIKHGGNARRHDPVPVFRLPIVTGPIPPELLQSE